MNLTKLKNYAPQARLAFIQEITDRAAFYGVTAAKIEPIAEKGDVAFIGGREHPRAVVPKRKALEELVAQHGFVPTMEKLAYTWFNRLVAIRYMELHGYLNHGYRVLSHPEGKPTPEILEHAEHVDLLGLDKQTVVDLKLDGNKDAQLYRLLLVAQCNALSEALPFLFARINDEAELVLPDNLLHSESLIRKLVGEISQEDCGSVEILGWLYQFYISERKDQVMARKSAVPTEDIPAVTQLFTPHWIVRYLVENSLGRLWLLNRPSSQLRQHMPYYIEGDPEADFLKINKPEEIRLCDPAVGSGHMLTYAFDLLTLIYEEEGYAPTEIPALILRHNLHGLEICPRAAQLAELALVFKAREKSRRFFQPEHLVRPHIIELRDVRFAENELRDYIHALGLGDLFNQPMLRLLHQFEEAKNFGSLIQPCLDERAIADARRAIEAKDLGGQLFLRETHLKVLRVLEQAEALSQRYHVVVANPPYMGGKQMGPALKEFGQLYFPDSKSDTFAMFIEQGIRLVRSKGYAALVTMQSWMFLSSYEAFRKRLLGSQHISTLIQIGYNSFPELNSKVVQACAFVIENAERKNRGLFVNLNDAPQAANKEHVFNAKLERNEIVPEFQAEFSKIPGSPIAYLVSKSERDIFARHPMIDDTFDPRQGMATGDNTRFVRDWFEVSQSRSLYSCSSKTEAFESGCRWFPYNKGGSFMRWYGNHEDVVAFDQASYSLLKNQGNHCPSEQRYFIPNVGWSKVSSSLAAFRLYPKGFIFDVAGCSIFQRNTGDSLYTVAGFLNSVVAKRLLTHLSPTLNFEVGTIKQLPLAKLSDGSGVAVRRSVEAAVSLARADWDNFETSWDFRDLPLLRPGLNGATLEASWRNWEAQSTAAIRRMQELETENNRLFIAAYGLDGELQPEVPEAQITLARAEARRDMAAFLSYAVGCMMGRYSPDHPGLILANAGDSLREFLEKVGKPLAELTFTPDEDGIIPVLDGEWFEDDIVARTREFLRATFGEATIEDNLRFLEEALGKDLRKYFLTDFYKDHLQTYKRRPIYWLFSSGKQRAFQCLVYLHRYNEATLSRMRTEYVIPLQSRVTARIELLKDDVSKATSTSHRKKLQKEQDDLKKQQTELLAFDEKLKHTADQKIKLDLDDGVKVNYGKFGDLLAEVKAVTGGADE